MESKSDGYFGDDPMLLRIIRFYKRFKNQYRIHKHGLSLWTILRISWMQSKHIQHRMNVVVPSNMIPTDLPKSFNVGIDDAFTSHAEEMEKQ